MAESAQSLFIAAVRDGRVVIHPPVRTTDGRYAVVLEDKSAGETVTKVFGSQSQALDWTARQLVGVAPHQTKVSGTLTGCSALDPEPSIAEGLAAELGTRSPDTSGDVVASGEQVDKRARVASNTRGRFALRGVKDVLESYGLDPAAEICKVLTTQIPLRDKLGNAVLGDDGRPIMVDALDIETRTKTLVELQQFVSPKLKAVEVKVMPPEPNLAEVEEKILALASGAHKRQRSTDVVDAVEVLR